MGTYVCIARQPMRCRANVRDTRLSTFERTVTHPPNRAVLLANDFLVCTTTLNERATTYLFKIGQLRSRDAGFLVPGAFGRDREVFLRGWVGCVRRTSGDKDRIECH